VRLQGQRRAAAATGCRRDACGTGYDRPMAESTWTTQPTKGVFDSTVDLPGSKSLTNRALVLAALANGPCVLENVLFADDTRHMLENLQKLGLSIDIDEANRRVSIAPKASPDFATK